VFAVAVTLASELVKPRDGSGGHGESTVLGPRRASGPRRITFTHRRLVCVFVRAAPPHPPRHHRTISSSLPRAYSSVPPPRVAGGRHRRKCDLQGRLYSFKGPWTNKKIRPHSANFYIKITVYSTDNKNYSLRRKKNVVLDFRATSLTRFVENMWNIYISK